MLGYYDRDWEFFPKYARRDGNGRGFQSTWMNGCTVLRTKRNIYGLVRMPSCLCDMMTFQRWGLFT
jgi:hypothetical protein